VAKYDEIVVSYEDLLLDPNNYRFQDDPKFVVAAENRFHEPGVQDRAAKSLRDQSLTQLKNSILRNGLLPFEKLIVKAYPKSNGKYVVLEGNRRLAAIRWIVEDDLAGVEVPKSVLKQIKNIPVFLLKSDPSDPVFQEAVLGVRHVSGIKEWGGYQRARLVVSLRDKFELDTQDIAARLAMSPVEVNRRYRAFKSLEQMQESEDYGPYARSDMYPLFHEAVSQPKIREWLGWNDDTAAFENEAELEGFYGLIAPGEDDEGSTIAPKIRTYADVRDLATILRSSEARSVLFDPERSFNEALAIAKGPELSRAWKQRVASATDALNNISPKQMKAFAKDDMEAITTLKDAVEELLANYKKLTN
jgi:hypothetical protein